MASSVTELSTLDSSDVLLRAQRQLSSSHSSLLSSSTVIVVVVLLVIIAGGVVAYLLYKKRWRGKATTATDSSSTISTLTSINSSGMYFTSPRSTQSALTPTTAPICSQTEIKAMNANIRQKSKLISAFCNDQALLPKFASYSSIGFTHLITRGKNGEIWLGEYAGDQVAIKRLLRDRKSHIEEMEELSQEIRLTACLNHPNVVRFIGFSWQMLSDLCMIAEYMCNGDLASFLNSKASRKLTWKKEKRTLAIDIATGLAYLHAVAPGEILHRDLRSINVLLDGNYQPKLSCFGLNRKRSLEETMQNGIAALYWTAPEVLRGESYSNKADIYSLGVILSEIDTCLPPYALNEQVDCIKPTMIQLLPLITKNQVTPRFQPECPTVILELAQSCFHWDPADRPEAMDIVHTLESIKELK